MFSINDYDYSLPEELIAQVPAGVRDESRLFCINREKNRFCHLKFKDLLEKISENDLFVINNTKVVPARFSGRKETGGKAEILILDYLQGLKSYKKNKKFICQCLVKSSRRPKKGSIIQIENDFYAKINELEDKKIIAEFISKNSNIVDKINSSGILPLPPYIKRPENKNFLEDKTRYQTVFAKKTGAVAAPTAGLHFTREIIEKIYKKGSSFAEITLFVGYGTFGSVETEDIRDHKIHEEEYFIEENQAELINNAVKAGKRIIAVGTTSVRTLEFACDENGFVKPGSGNCDLFIYPGYKFKIVDSMITNFHLPKSSLLMLISAFAGLNTVKSAYREAVEKKYRFYSYGDSMFIE